MAAMNKEQFAISIGITTDTAQNERVVNDILEQVRNALNKGFNMNIEAGDFDEVLRQLDLYKDKINVVQDLSDDTFKNIKVTINDMNGSVITLNTNVRTLTQSLQEFRAAGASLADVRNAIKSGSAYDADGGQVTDARKTNTVSTVQNIVSESTISTLSRAKSLLQDIEDKQNEIIKLEQKLGSLKEGTNKYENLKNSITQAKSELDAMNAAAKDAGAIKNVQDLTAAYEKKTQAIIRDREASKADAAEAAQEKQIISLMNQRVQVIQKLNAAERKNDSTMVAYYTASRQNIERELSQYSQLIDSNSRLTAEKDKLLQRERELNAQRDSDQDNSKIQEAIGLYQQLVKAQTELYELKQKKASNGAIAESTTEVNNLTAAVQQATSAELSNGTAVQENAQYREAANSADREGARAQTELDARYKSSTFSLASMAEQLRKVAAQTLQYKMTIGAWNSIQSAIGQSVDKIRELDKSMTDIQMVIGLTNSEMQQLMVTYSEMAIQLGTTTAKIAEGSAEWFRQGKTVSEVQELLNASTILSVTGNMDAAQSTELLTASLNGFRLEATEAISLVDKFVEADLNFATSAAEIATAMQYVASSADVAGISIDKMVGLITTVSSTTRMSAETIGNSMKTIISRMQNIKLGKFVDEEFGEPLNDVEKVLEKLGIRLRDNEQEWRNMEEVLDEVGSRWQEFTQIEQSAIAVALGGTRQRNQLLAIFENYDVVLQATAVSMDSAGAAASRYEIYLDSIEAKINQFTATWEKLVLRFNQSDTFKGVVDAGTKLLEVLDVLINDFHAIEAIAFVGAISGIKMLFTSFMNLANGIRAVQAATIALNAIQDISNTAALTQAVQGLTAAQAAQALAVKGVSAEEIKKILVTKGLTAVEAERIITSNATVAANTLATFSFSGLTSAIYTNIVAFVTWMATNPVGWILLIVGAIVGLVAGLDWLSKSVERQEEKVRELEDAYKELKTELTSLESELERTAERIDELNEKGTLTLVEQEELRMLQDSNRELELRLQYLKTEEEIARRTLLAEKENLYGQKQGRYDSSEDKTAQYREQINTAGAGLSSVIMADVSDVSAHLAAYQEISERVNQTQGEIKDIMERRKPLAESDVELTKEQEKELKNINNELKIAESNLEHYNGLLEDETKILNDNASELLDYYSVLKQIEEPTAEQSALLENVRGQLALINQEMNPEQWMTFQFSEVFDSEQMEDVRKKLQGIKEDLNSGKTTASEYNAAVKEVFDSILANEDLNLGEIFTPEDLENTQQMYTYLEDLTGLSFDNVALFLDNSGDLQATVDAFGDLGLTLSEVQSIMMDDGVWSVGETQFRIIANAAKEFGIEVDQLIPILIDLGVVANDALDLDETFNNTIAGLKNLDSAFDVLSQAQSELIENGYLTADSLEAIMENNLLEYLYTVGDELYFNVDALDAKRNMLVETAKQEIYAAGAAEINAITMKYSAQTANTAGAAIAIFGLNAYNAGLNSQEAAKGVKEFNAAMAEANALMDGLNADAAAAMADEIQAAEDKMNGMIAALDQVSLGTDHYNQRLRENTSAAKSAASANNDLSQALKGAQSSINSLLDMTMSMLKQRYQDMADAVSDAISSLTDEYNAEKASLDASKKARDKAYNEEKDRINKLKKQRNKEYQDEKERINNIKKERKKQYDAQKEDLKDVKEAQDDIDDAAMNALKDQLKAYQDKINAEIKLLRLKEEEDKYEKELANKNNDLAKLQAELAELEYDNSLAAQKRKLELLEQMANQQEDIDEFQADRGLDLAEQALQDELERYEKQIEDKIAALEREKEKRQEIYDAAIEQIEAEQEAFNEAMENKLAQIEAEKKAYDEMMDDRLERLEEQKQRDDERHERRLASIQAEYEAEKARLEAELKAIQDKANDEVGIRNEAIALIEGRTDEFYQALIEWNRQYGTHIDTDVIQTWNRAYTALDQFGYREVGVQAILEQIARDMWELEDGTQSVARAFDEAAAAAERMARAAAEAAAAASDATGGSSGGSNKNSNNKKGKKNHSGTPYVTRTKSDDNLAEQFGLSSDEVVRVLQVGESITSKHQNAKGMTSSAHNMDRVIAQNVSKISESTNKVTNNNGGNGSLTVEAPIVIKGNADASTVKMLEKERDTIVDCVFSKIQKHTKLGGFNNMKAYGF